MEIIKEVTISNKKNWLPNFSEIMQNHGVLLFALVSRNIKLRYKQTILGILWVLIQPLALSGVFALFFGRFVSASSGKDSYITFVLVGVWFWQFFSRSISDSTTSLVSFSSVITKVYFPRLLIPIASILTALFDFLITLPLIILVLFIMNSSIPLASLYLIPFAVCNTLLIALGLGLCLCSMNILFRDLQHIVPFLLQLGLYISPVVYAANTIPEQWRFVYSLNPLVPIFETVRYALLPSASVPQLTSILISILIGIALVILGSAIFSRVENIMVDRI